MQPHRPIASLLGATLVTALVGPSALAQQGSLDQVGLGNHSLDLQPGHLAQQQVRAGRDGVLEGVEIVVSGAPAGSTFGVRIRRGPGWSTSPVLWEGSDSVSLLPGAVSELFYFDVSSAGIQLVQDELFVIELETFFNHSSQLKFSVYANGPAQYPEPFFYDGAIFPSSANWSLTFRTWMDGGTGVRYCSTASNSHSLDGAVLSVQGSSSVAANDLVLTASRVPDNVGLFFFGPGQAQVPFGNGFRCISGKVHRLPASQAQQFFLTYVVDHNLPEVSPLVPGTTWNFQAWYRDPKAGGAGYNLSDAVQLSFLP